jgi:hypothetical protein
MEVGEEAVSWHVVVDDETLVAAGVELKPGRLSRFLWRTRPRISTSTANSISALAVIALSRFTAIWAHASHQHLGIRTTRQDDGSFKNARTSTPLDV